MSQNLSDILARVDVIASGVTAAHAARVDSEGVFPTETLAALTEAGLMGLVTPTAAGGLGLGTTAAAHVVNRFARECGTTAMVVCMHYSGAAVLAAHGSAELNREVAAGRHLSTLAFSEAGSRSHFWAPMSTAKAEGDTIVLDAKKSWVTSARHATGYVWSSGTVSAEGASTIWYVPRGAAGIDVVGRFDGLGLRGNDSTPVSASGVRIPAANRLGEDGGGFNIMMGVVLPMFSALNAGCALGLAESAVERAAAHARGTSHAHLNSALRDLPTIRAYLAKARVQVDMARCMWLDTLTALETGRADAQLRVLEVKAGVGDAALEITQTTMRVCGGAAFRREGGVDRYFRDAQAMSVMAPTSDVLYDFIGKALTGMDLF